MQVVGSDIKVEQREPHGWINIPSFESGSYYGDYIEFHQGRLGNWALDSTSLSSFIGDPLKPDKTGIELFSDEAVGGYSSIRFFLNNNLYAHLGVTQEMVSYLSSTSLRIFPPLSASGNMGGEFGFDDISNPPRLLLDVKDNTLTSTFQFWANGTLRVVAPNTTSKAALFLSIPTIATTRIIVQDASNTEVDSNWNPNPDNTYDLGTSLKRWRNLFCSNNADIGNQLIVSGQSSFGNHLLPSSGSVDLGSNASKFRDLWLSGIIRLGSAGTKQISTDNISFAFNGHLVPTTDHGFDLGTPTNRWNNVRAANFITGDITMDNDFVITEEGEKAIAFLNPRGEKVAILDRQGNLYLKGRVRSLDEWRG
jgi:hypothetical protein